jgi:cation transport ATPase
MKYNLDSPVARTSYATIQSLLDENDPKYAKVRQSLKEDAEHNSRIIAGMTESKRKQQKHQRILDKVFNTLSIILVVASILILIATFVWVVFIEYSLVITF